MGANVVIDDYVCHRGITLPSIRMRLSGRRVVLETILLFMPTFLFVKMLLLENGLLSIATVLSETMVLGIFKQKGKHKKIPQIGTVEIGG